MLLSHEDFVVAWQSSESLAEAAKKTKTTPRAASMRAFNMRKAGVPLKVFKRVGEKYDVAGLTALAKKAKTAK